jgi:signal transduction histidine kinase
MSSDISRNPGFLLSSETLLETAMQSRANAGEFTFWLTGSVTVSLWAAQIGSVLYGKLSHRGAAAVEAILLKNSGTTALLFSTVLLILLALAAAAYALRGGKVAQPFASVFIVTAVALRSIQLFYQGSASVLDADLLGAAMLAAALTYHGSSRLWWGVLMPLGTAACLAPLIWFEFFKGAGEATLVRALLVPGASFALGSILIVARELRARTDEPLSEMDRVHARGLELKSQMYSMESDLKSLLSLLSKKSAVEVSISQVAETAQTQIDSSTHLDVEAAPIEPAASVQLSEQFKALDAGPLATTDFSAARSASPSESCTYEDIDRGAREVLDEVRLQTEGKKNIRLLLTAPTGATVPLAVRGTRTVVSKWLKALVANSVDSLGGFPDGVVRVTLRPGLNSVIISIEDNGRGFNDDMLTKLGASQEGRMSSKEVRREVEQLGGSFDVQARLGVGARLTIELPRVDVRPTLVRSNDFRPSTSSSLHA